MKFVSKKIWRKLLIAVIAIESVSFIILFLYELLFRIEDTASIIGLSMAFISILLTAISLCEKSPSEKIADLDTKINGINEKLNELISNNSTKK